MRRFDGLLLDARPEVRVRRAPRGADQLRHSSHRFGPYARYQEPQEEGEEARRSAVEPHPLRVCRPQ